MQSQGVGTNSGFTAVIWRKPLKLSSQKAEEQGSSVREIHKIHRLVAGLNVKNEDKGVLAADSSISSMVSRQ